MTAEELHRRTIQLVDKYDRGIYTLDEAGTALWRLAQTAADDAREVERMRRRAGRAAS